MHRKTLGLLLIIIGTTFVALGIYTSTFSTTTQTQTKTIAPSQNIFVQIDLSQGDKVKGALSINEGNQGISVYVENPSKVVVYDGGVVYTRLDFSLTAQTTGDYIVNFNNTSPANTQIIEYSLTYPSNQQKTLGLITSIAGVILLVSGLSMMFISYKTRAKP